MKYIAYSLALAVAVWASSADAQSFKTLLSFTGTGTVSGYFPYGGLTLSGTTLYGMTGSNGVNIPGSIFSVGTDGTNYQNLATFTGNGGSASGLDPKGNLTLSGTTLYGMTREGGVNFDGNIFSIGTRGTNYQDLVSFTEFGGATTGFDASGSLTLSGTTLYGMTKQGSANRDGNIFSVGVDGTNYLNLLSFTGTGGAAVGARPYGSLTLSGSTLYGMTSAGGTKGDGNIFSVGTDGTSYISLISFTGTGGSASGIDPQNSLALSGTTLYGMTVQGGSNGLGNIFSVGVDGTNFYNLLSFTGTGGAALV